MQHPLANLVRPDSPPFVQKEGEESSVTVEWKPVFPDSVMCHVSPTLIKDRLMPNSRSVCNGYPPAIFFTENELMSNYGELVYLFSKKLLVEKYGLQCMGAAAHRFRNSLGEEGRESVPFIEYVCHRPVEIADAIGVIKHRSMSKSDFDIL